jgi:Flp pilus assembly protein TadD
LWALAVAPVLVTAFVYRDSLYGPLIFDDEYTIRINTHVRSLSGIWGAAFGTPHSTLTSRPVSAATFVINFHFGQLNVFGYHVVNLAIHLICTLLLWGLVRRTLIAPNVDERVRPAAPWLATLVALLWSVHPLQTEAVEYITQRTTLLMGMFMLATLYGAARSWTLPHSARWQAMAVACCALGMGSKEDMVAAPLLIIAYDATFFAASWKDAFARRGKFYMALASTWILLVAFIAMGPSNPTTGLHGKLSITSWEYLLTQARAITRYLRLAFWPRPLILAYDWKKSTSVGDVWLQGLMIVALLAATGVGLWLRRWWGWLGAWFFLILAPTSSVMPIATEFVAERRMYLPLLSVIAIVLVGGYSLLLRLIPNATRVSSGVAIAVSVLAMFGLARASHARLDQYESALVLWTATAEDSPNSGMAQSNLANALLASGDTTRALEHFDQALKIDPGNSESNTNLCVLYQQMGQPAKAVQHGRDAVAAWPERAVLHVNLALALIDIGEIAEAMAEAQKAIQLEPESSKAYNCLGILLARQGRYAEAEPIFRKAMQVDHSDPLPYYNMAQMRIEQGRQPDGSVSPDATAASVALIRQGSALQPSDAEGHRRLGRALTQQGDLVGALREFEIAAQLKPMDQANQNDIAQIRAHLGGS